MRVRKKVFVKASRSDVERFQSETRDKDEYRRATAILLHADGRSYKEVAEILGVKRNAAIVWVRNFRNQGLEALIRRYSQGKQPTLTREEKNKIIDTALNKPNLFGYLKSEWSMRFLSRYFSEELGIKVSKSHVHRLLTEAGIKFKRPKASIDKDKNSTYYRKKKELNNYRKIAPALKKGESGSDVKMKLGSI